MKHWITIFSIITICYMPVFAGQDSKSELALGQSWEFVKNIEKLKPRDSSGEVFFKDNIFIYGGWYDSNFQNLSDGVRINPTSGLMETFELGNVPFLDIPVALVFKGMVFLTSGWVDGRKTTARPSNDIIVSADGVNFSKAGNGAFSPRVGAAGVVFKEKVYIIGGTEQYHNGDRKSLLNDVWSSSDGVNYSIVTTSANFLPRAFHQAFVHGGKLCVIGGGSYKPDSFAYNDLWCSRNGKDFDLIVQNLPFTPRIWFSVIVHDGYVWVLGGDDIKNRKLLNDIWVSKDLINWAEVKFEKIWSPRHEHSAVLVKDTIYIVGGNASPLSNEIWKYKIPKGFERSILRNK